MSGASPFRRSVADASSFPGAQWLGSAAVGAARFTGFWSAVVSPFALLGLVVSGVATQDVSLFGLVLALNLIGLVLGRKYHPE